MPVSSSCRLHTAVTELEEKAKRRLEWTAGYPPRTRAERGARVVATPARLDGALDEDRTSDDEVYVATCRPVRTSFTMPP